jgi:hypothetical protein
MKQRAKALKQREPEKRNYYEKWKEIHNLHTNRELPGSFKARQAGQAERKNLLKVTKYQKRHYVNYILKT